MSTDGKTVRVDDPLGRARDAEVRSVRMPSVPGQLAKAAVLSLQCWAVVGCYLCISNVASTTLIL